MPFANLHMLLTTFFFFFFILTKDAAELLNNKNLSAVLAELPSLIMSLQNGLCKSKN